MKNKPSKLQKLSLGFALFSFVAGIACAVYLWLHIDALGWEDPISASLLASTFFFGFITFIFIVIGKANIPSFKVGS